MGYFDEQLRVAGDGDLWMRIVLISAVKRTPGILGYFHDEGTGLSTSGPVHAVERAVVEIRYRIYDKLNYLAVLKAVRMYRIRALLVGGQYEPVGRYLPRHRMQWIRDLFVLLLGLVLYPLRFVIPNVAKLAFYLVTEKPNSWLARIETKTGIRVRGNVRRKPL